MTWVAFDRSSRTPGSTAQQRAHWKKIAARDSHDICKNGVDKKRGCFVQAYGSTRMDASLLLLPLVGFLPPSDPRIKATVQEIEKRLLHKGLVSAMRRKRAWMVCRRAKAPSWPAASGSRTIMC